MVPIAEVKWIKIVTDIFDDEKILLIESMPDKYAIIVCWFKLLCLAGKQNNQGVFLMNNRIAYTDEMLSTIFRMPINTVRMSLQTFEQFGMIELIDGVITIPNWGKHQSIDKIESKNEYMRNYMKGYREKQKALAGGKDNCKSNSKANVSSLDKNRLEEIREEENRGEYIEEAAPPKTSRHKYGMYENVLLSDEEYKKLTEEFPHDYTARIERLSEYIASSGKKYKNHLATIRTWARKEAETKPRNGNQRNGNVFLEIAQEEGLV